MRFYQLPASLIPASLLLGLALCSAPARGADTDASKERVSAALDAEADAHGAVARQIWEFAELGYQEEKSSALLQARLAEAGFSVTPGVAGMPTAFLASAGSGSPTVGILAEFDALPGLSQESRPCST